jgi:hypothetical protein
MYQISVKEMQVGSMLGERENEDTSVHCERIFREYLFS